MRRFQRFFSCLLAALFLVSPSTKGEARSIDPLFDFNSSGQIINREEVRKDALLQVLRTYGDFRAVLKYFDQETADTAELRSVRAASLAAAGNTKQAQEVLGQLTKEEGQSEWALIAEALIARQSQDIYAARATISKAVSAAPMNAYAHNVAGTIEAADNKWMSAVEKFSAAVALAPDSAIYLANLGGSYVQTQNYRAAMSHLNKAIELQPDFCAPRLARATLHDIQGDFDNVESDLLACLETEPNEIAARALISAQIASSHLGRAEASLQRFGGILGNQANVLSIEVALQTDKGQPALDALGRVNLPEEVKLPNEVYAHLLMGQDAVAFEKARTVLAMLPEAPTVHTLVLGLEILNERNVESDVSLSRPLDQLFIALATTDPEAKRGHWLRSENFVPGLLLAGLKDSTPVVLSPPEVRDPLVRGMLLFERGLNMPAAESLSAAISTLGDEDTSAAGLLHYLRASALLRSTERKAGEEALQKAITIAPEFVAAHFFLGELQARQARFDEALVSFQTAFDLMPSPGHAVRLGATAEVVGEIDTAIAAYRFLIDQLPASHVGYNQLAWVLVSNDRDLQEAEELARRALKLAPEDGPTMDTLGWILFQRGEVEESLTFLRRAFESGGASSPLIAYHLAQAESDSGNLNRARELYDYILSYGEDAFVISQETKRLRNAL